MAIFLQNLVALALVLSVCVPARASLACAPGYSCFNDTAKSVVWSMKLDGNIYGPTCSEVCDDSLCPTGQFHVAVPNQPMLRGAAFDPVANGLGFNCTSGGCWGSNSSGGMIWVKKGQNMTSRTCYFPPESTFSTSNVPGNANCYGERYSLVCPCKPAPIEQACTWSSPPNYPAVARFPVDPNSTSCIDRINYWRKRACDEGWVECPPCGLPPMTECVACHQCANSQAAWDKTHGAHNSFQRCGEMVQGEGGGRNCAAVIDSFVSERGVFPDSNGTMVCRGHCGPIVSPGCNTFFWGKDATSDFYTLNWRSCNPSKCDGYCNNPTANACFLVNNSPAVGYPYPTLKSPATRTEFASITITTTLALVASYFLLKA